MSTDGVGSGSAPATVAAQKALQKLIPQLRKKADELLKKKGESAKDAAEFALFPTSALDQLTGAAVKDIFASAGKDFEEAGKAFKAVRQSWTTPFIDAAQLKRLLGESAKELEDQGSLRTKAEKGQKYSPAELQAVLYDLLDTKTAREAFTKAIDADKGVQEKLTALRVKDGDTQEARDELATLLVKVFDSKVLTEKFGYKLSDGQKTALKSVLTAEKLKLDNGETGLLDYFITPPSNAPVEVAKKRAFATLAIGCSTALAVSAAASFLGIAMLSGVGSVIALGAMIATAVIVYKAYRTNKLEKFARKNAVFSSLRNQINEKFVKKDIQRTTKAATMANKIRTAAAVAEAAAKGLLHGAAGTAKGAAGVGVGAVGLAATTATFAASLPVAGAAAAGVATAHGAKRAADETSKFYHAGIAASAKSIAKGLKKAAEGLDVRAQKHAIKSRKESGQSRS